MPGPIGAVFDTAEGYMRGRKGAVEAPKKYHELDKSHAARVAQAYDELPMYDPDALPHYEAMIKETLDQYNAMKNAGVKITPVDATTYPYGSNPRAAVKDIGDNKHMAVFKSDAGFGTGHAAQHPLLGQSGIVEAGHPMTHNDLFRAVHDYYGHAKEGYGFRAAGEDNAFRSHASMYSPKALPAMANETRGQNAWLNWGPHGDFNRTASQVDTIYAPQKVVALPEWTWADLVKKYGLAGAMATPVAAGAMGSVFDQRQPEMAQ
jgi:hypothetical protein